MEPTRRNARLMPGVDLTADVKGWEQLVYVCLSVLSAELAAEPEPVRHDG